MENFVFGYGSLMNPKSRARTLPGPKPIPKATLRGYQRKFDLPVDGHLYLNIVPRTQKEVEGVLIPVSEEELALLQKRERGYDCVNVTKFMSIKPDGMILAFIAPERNFPGLTILQTYIDTCLGGIPADQHQALIKDSIIENEIENDRESQKYANVAK